MLTGTENGSAPFWSPDGTSIGFFAGGKLKVLQLASGSVRVVRDTPPDASGTWITADVILGTRPTRGCLRGQRCERRGRDVTELDRSTGELRRSGRRRCPMAVILSISQTARTGSLRRSHQSTKRALRSGPVRSQVVATPSGRDVRARRRSLSQRLDVAAGRMTGEPRCWPRSHPAGDVLRWQVLGLACHARLPEAEELPACPNRIFDRWGRRSVRW
jgi:serine/threonine-protein kinase